MRQELRSAVGTQKLYPARRLFFPVLIQTFHFCIVFFTPYHFLLFAPVSRIYDSGLKLCSSLSNNREKPDVQLVLITFVMVLSNTIFNFQFSIFQFRVSLRVRVCMWKIFVVFISFKNFWPYFMPKHEDWRLCKILFLSVFPRWFAAYDCGALWLLNFQDGGEGSRKLVSSDLRIVRF